MIGIARICSPKPRDMHLIDPSAKCYGRVTFAERGIIEASVIVGHPPAVGVLSALEHAPQATTLQAFLEALALDETVIGGSAIIRSGTVIYAGVRIGDEFDCGHNVIIREGTIVGDGVYVKNNTEIMAHARIGNGCRVAGVLADGSVLGDRVSSFGTLTHTYPRYVPPAHGLPSPPPLPRDLEAPVIEDDVIIGRGAVVIGRVTIGAGAVIGPNAIVTSDVPRGARVIVPPAHMRVST